MRALRVLARPRRARCRAGRSSAGTSGSASGGRAALAPRLARRRAAERAHGRAPAARRPRRAAAAGRAAQPGAGVLPAARRCWSPLARRRRLRAAFRYAAPAARRAPASTRWCSTAGTCRSRSRARCATTSSTSLQHASFIFAGILVWWPALEPKRRRLRGELWKIGHIIAARMLGMFLGMAFVLIREPVYTGVYGTGERRGHRRAGRPADRGRDDGRARHRDHGLRAGFFFWHAAQQHDRDEARASAARARYLTVSVPSMPPSRWPGTEQKNVYSPGFRSTSTSTCRRS